VAQQVVQVLVVDHRRGVPARIAVDRHPAHLGARQEVAAGVDLPPLVDPPVGPEGLGVAEDEEEGGGGRGQLELGVELAEDGAQPLELRGGAPGALFTGVAEQGEAGGAQLDPLVPLRRQGGGRQRYGQ